MSQFLYVGMNGTANWIKWDDASRPGFAWQMNLVHRPSRYWAYGMEVGFIGKLGEGAIGYPWKRTSSGRFNLYKPTVYEYSIKHSPVVTGIVRGYLETKWNAYVEFRVSTTRVTESFRMDRPFTPAEPWDGPSYEVAYAAIPAVMIRENNSRNVTFFGLSAGISPHITERLYFSCSAVLETGSYGKQSFTHTVDISGVFTRNYNNMDQIASRLAGNAIRTQLNIGCGLLF